MTDRIQAALRLEGQISREEHTQKQGKKREEQNVLWQQQKHIYSEEIRKGGLLKLSIYQVEIGYQNSMQS